MKRVAFIADDLDNAYKIQQVLAHLGVEVSAGSTMQLKKIFEAPCDLVIFEARGIARGRLAEVESLCERDGRRLLVIVEERDIDLIGYPNAIACDFVVPNASQEEYVGRVRRLLHEGADEADSAGTELITVENMTMNLATYQVAVSGIPVDFTYLEYTLLAFLVQHPNRTFTRDELLLHVWGLDYYGGSRTVDVHVRRIRSKLGPELAQRLETVRGVGYLWSV